MLSEQELRNCEALLMRRQQENDKVLADLAESCESTAAVLPISRLPRNDSTSDQQAVLHFQRQRELQRTRIMTALDRLRAGKYGVCVMCREPIDRKRLEIIPESPLCASCLDNGSVDHGR